MTADFRREDGASREHAREYNMSVLYPTLKGQISTFDDPKSKFTLEEAKKAIGVLGATIKDADIRHDDNGDGKIFWNTDAYPDYPFFINVDDEVLQFVLQVTVGRKHNYGVIIKPVDYDNEKAVAITTSILD